MGGGGKIQGEGTPMGVTDEFVAQSRNHLRREKKKGPQKSWEHWKERRKNVLIKDPRKRLGTKEG